MVADITIFDPANVTDNAIDKAGAGGFDQAQFL